MRAKFISEAIKHLSPKSDEELLVIIEKYPILDQIKELDNNSALRKKILPFSNETKQKIRAAIKYAPLYEQLGIILDIDSHYLDWLITEIKNKLIKEAKTISINEIAEYLSNVIEYKTWNCNTAEFLPTIEILFKRAKEYKINVMQHGIIREYMHKNNMDFMEYITKFSSGNFDITKKDSNIILTFDDWDDFAEFFIESREIDHEAIEKILSGDGSEFFLGYREDDDFPAFSPEFLKKIESIFSDLKEFVIKKHPDAKRFDNILELWDFMETLENDDELDPYIRKLIIKTSNETAEIADEDAAYDDLKKSIINFFDITNIEYKDNQFISFISKKGANKLVTLIHDPEIIDGIDYTPPRYGWSGDPEKHPDVFIDAFYDKIENI